MGTGTTERLDGRVILVTPRLTLRSFRAGDLPGFAAMHTDPKVMVYLGGKPLSRSVSDAIAIGAAQSFATTGVGKLAIERNADGVFLGMCGLSHEDWYPDDLELGWRLAAEHWGQGYASEAASAWLGYAFATLGAERVISIADVPNSRSIAVMKRIGMRLDHEAELTDHSGPFAAAIYALSASDWRARLG